MTDTPAPYSKAQRLLFTVLGGLGVAALAAGTFVLSYDDLRALAIRGGAVRHRAFLYPAMIDGLVVVIILSILIARRAAWWPRAVRWLLLLTLVAGAGAAGVQRAVKGYGALPHTSVSGGVALAPWVILVLALWLWISMIKQALSLRSRRRRPGPDQGSAPPTVVEKAAIPGLTDDEPEDTRPLPWHSPARELGPGRAAPEPVAASAGRRAPAEPGPLPRRTAPPDRRAEPEPVPAASHEPTAPNPAPARPAPARERTEPSPAPRPAARADSAEPGPRAARRPVRPDRYGPIPVPTASRGAAEPRPEPEPHPAGEAREPDTAARPGDDRPAPPVARTSLPTDVMLVGGPPKKKPKLADTQPDGIKLPDTRPGGIPAGAADEEDDAYTDERAEDPDAGDAAIETDAPGEHTGHASRRCGAGTPGHRPGPGSAAEEEMESPPSSKFRSSPTPPRD